MPSARHPPSKRRLRSKDASWKRWRKAALPVSTSTTSPVSASSSASHPTSGQFPLARILDAHGDEVVAPIGMAHRAPQEPLLGERIAGRLKIRDQEHDGAPMQYAVDEIERLDAVRARAGRHVIENIAHRAQTWRRPFFGGR
jgi:hypothetical protein